MKRKLFRTLSVLLSVLIFAAFARGSVWAAETPKIYLQAVPRLLTDWDSVTDYEPYTIPVTGRVELNGLDPAACSVIAFIDDGVWLKPTWANYLVEIGADGFFSLHITTGGHDADIDEFELFIVRTADFEDVEGSSLSRDTVAGKCVCTTGSLKKSSFAPELPAPQASLEDGRVIKGSAFTLSIHGEPSGGEIYYTTDGGDPLNSALRRLYETGLQIAVNQDLMVKAVAINGNRVSKVTELDYHAYVPATATPAPSATPSAAPSPPPVPTAIPSSSPAPSPPILAAIVPSAAMSAPTSAPAANVSGGTPVNSMPPWVIPGIILLTVIAAVAVIFVIKRRR
jgi:hypothetical protein